MSNDQMQDKSVRRFTRRQMLLGLGVGVTGLILAACAPKPAPTTAPKAATAAPAATKPSAATPAPKAPATIRFHGRSGSQGDYFTKQAADFVAQNPDIKLTVEVLPTADYDKQLSTLLAGGELGDGYHNYPFGIYYPFAARGVAADILPLVEKEKFDLSIFFPATVDQLRWEGKLTGWPQGAHPGWTSQFTNLTAWKEAGAPLPEWEWTYEKEWLEAMKKVTVDSNKDGVPERYGFLFDYNPQGAYTFIKSWGSDWIDPETGKKSLINSEKTTAALMFMHDLVWKHKVSPPQKAIVAAMLGNGLTTSHTGNIAALASQRAAAAGKFDMKVFPMPKGPGGRGGFVGIDTLCIHSATKSPDAVFAYIKFLTTKENNIKQMDAGFTPPVRFDSWKEPPLINDEDQQVAFRWMEVAKAGVFPKNARASEFITAFTQGFQAFMLEENKNNTAAQIKALHDAVQEVLDKPLL